MLTNSKVLWRKNNRWKAERYQGGARIVRVDLRKMTFGQRLEGSEGASHVNIQKKSALKGENQYKGPEAEICLVNTKNNKVRLWAYWLHNARKKMGQFMY